MRSRDGQPGWLAPVGRALSAGMAVLALTTTGLHAQPMPSPALDALASQASAEGRVKVLVRLNTAWRAEAVLGHAGRAAQRQALSAARSRLETALLALCSARRN